MSAFMVSPEHINCLVTALRRFEALPGRCGGEERAEDVDARAAKRVRLLTEENAASVAHRYGRFGQAHTDLAVYTYQPATWLRDGHRDAALLGKVLKLAQCYAYQACEAPSWETSEARAIVTEIQGHAIRLLGEILAPKLWATDSLTCLVE